MTKGKWFLVSGLLLLSAMSIQLFKAIHYFDKDLIDGLSAAFLGVGMAILLITLFKKKSK